MKNTTNNQNYLNKRTSKKDLKINKQKRTTRALVIIVIMLAVIVLYDVAQNGYKKIIAAKSNAEISNISNTNTTQQIPECENSTWGDNLVSFMNRLFTYPGNFWTKLFIFLGIIYLIQVCVSLTFDVIELALLVFVIIKRMVVWIYKKIRGKNEREEQLKKILEL
jgi:hypothetical protein